MSKTIIGVDPGKEGFITIINGDEISHFPIPKIGKECDLHALGELVLNISEQHDPANSVVIIEDVHALARTASGSIFNFGGVCFAIRMAFIMCGYPIVLVSPKKWQKEMYEGIHLNDDKKVMSVQAAKRLFPNQDLRRTPKCKKPDDNLTDSLLIAEYGRRHYK